MYKKFLISKSRFLVRYCNALERVRLLDVVEAVGIEHHYPNYSSLKYSDQDTNLFDINIRKKSIDYIGQPSIAAAMVSGGMRIYSVGEFCRIAELRFKKIPRFPVFHVPHDGKQLPEELLESVCIPQDEFLAYHEKMRDKEISAIIPGVQRNQACFVSFPISRLLCDVERFIGTDEIMEQYGMGFCYEKAHDGRQIKKITPQLLTKTRAYYDQHHDRMDRFCEDYRSILLFDLHSFSEDIVPVDFLQPNRETPDVCIGVDEKYTPPKLVELLKNQLERENIRWAVNYPYTGCFVPNSVLSGKSECDFTGIMIEVNKHFYCDREGAPIEGRTFQLRQILERLLVETTGVI